jgi:retron-type reverse transcriptase
MRENCTSGIAPGAPGNRRSYGGELPLGGVDITMETVLAPANMRAAWAAVKGNAGAAGVDGKGIAETEAHLNTHWPTVREKLLRGDDQPAAVRAVDIAKPSGWTRRLGIPALEDKRVQLAVAKRLGAIYEADFLDCSYGYRPGRSARDAVRTLSLQLTIGKIRLSR